MKVETIQNSQNSQKEIKRRNIEARLPKNIRQVGTIEEDKRIYIEDYVMTYIKQIATKSYGSYQVAVLLGHVINVEEEDSIFINGAVEVQDVIFDDDKVFSNENWARIYEDIKKYFEEAEIVGWYIARPGLALEVNEYLYNIHLDNFAGNNKVLLMYDSMEREEAFYLFQNQELTRQDGYYIYYEKNDAMQTYMIDHKDKESIEAGFVDQTCINIRHVMERKNNEKLQKKRSLSVMYAAASVCALFLVVVIMTMLSGRGVKDSNMPVAANNTGTTTSGQPAQGGENSSTTQVNVQPGNVSTIKDENVVGDDTNPNADDDVGVTIEDTKPIKSGDGKDDDSKDTGDKDDSQNAGNKDDSKDTDNKDTDSKDSNSGEQETSAKPSTYTVKRGDTLGAISLKFYNSKSHVKKIMEKNNLDNPDTIFAGQKLRLP